MIKLSVTMKKIVLVFGLLLAFAGAYAQSKVENKAQFFADEAAKEFGLSDKQKTAVYAAKLEQLKLQMEFAQKKKDGEFDSDEDFKLAKQEAMKPATDKLNKAIGASPKEVKAFNDKMQEPMKNLK